MEGPFERVGKESLSQQVYEQIRRLLMQGRLSPGQKLILRTMAKELGVSATPVREAFFRLASEDALVLDERGTVTVPSLDLARYLELRDLRARLESEAAARAASHATKTEIDELARIHGQLQESARTGNFSLTREYNQQFHLRVCKLARSPVLFGIIERLWMQCGPILSLLWTGEAHPDAEAHVIILQGLRRSDAEKARRGMVVDIIHGGAPLLERFPQGGGNRDGNSEYSAQEFAVLNANMGGPAAKRAQPSSRPRKAAKSGGSSAKKNR